MIHYPLLVRMRRKILNLVREVLGVEVEEEEIKKIVSEYSRRDIEHMREYAAQRKPVDFMYINSY